MIKMKGFILPSPFMLYGALGALLIIAGLAISVKVQTHRLATVKAEYATFVAQTKALGLVAQAKADKQNADLNSLKETIDHETKLNNDKLAAAAKRLRVQRRALGNILPKASATSGHPDIACLRRAESDAAIQRFVDGVAVLTEEGDSRTLEANAAKDWIKGWPDSP